MDDKSPTLMKTLDEWTPEEIQSLFADDGKGWDEVSKSGDDVDKIRARITADDNAAVTRDDIVHVLNWAEEMRLMTHIMVSMWVTNAERLRRIAADAGCAFCEWKYRDAEFFVPSDHELTDEEIQAPRDRVNDAIIEHVKVCPNHPSRLVEEAVDKATEIIEAASPVASGTDDTPVLTEVPELSLDQWNNLYTVLADARTQ